MSSSAEVVLNPDVGRPCLHRKVDGSPCRALAVRDSQFCHFHRLHNEEHDPLRREYFFNATYPALEDPRAVVLSVHNALRDFRHGHLDAKGCAMHLYGLQIASNMMPRPDARSPLEQQQLEAQAIALEALKLQTKSKPLKAADAKEKPPEEEGPSLLEMLTNTLKEIRENEFVRKDDVEGLQQALDANRKPEEPQK